MDAFLSHCSKDAALARSVERALKKAGVKVWLDQSEIRPGRLLRKELQGAIESSRAVVLLWSGAAEKSRWVSAELLTAFHLNRFIIVCAVDETPLPYFLQKTIFLNVRPRMTDWVRPLQRAIRQAPRGANEVPAWAGSETEEVIEASRRFYYAQRDLMDRTSTDLTGARILQARLDREIEAAEKRWPHEPLILNHAGYHLKNAYMLKHWREILAGRPPLSPLLERAERRFYNSLFGNPFDYSALNGLGSTLFYERELEAAEFFVRHAIRLSELDGRDYPEARHDLEILLWHQTQAPAARFARTRAKRRTARGARGRVAKARKSKSRA